MIIYYMYVLYVELCSCVASYLRQGCAGQYELARMMDNNSLSPTFEHELHPSSVYTARARHTTAFRSSSPLYTGASHPPALQLSPIKPAAESTCSFPANSSSSSISYTAVSSGSIAFRDISTCTDLDGNETTENTTAFLDVTEQLETRFEHPPSVLTGSLARLVEFRCCKRRCVTSIPLRDLQQCRKSFQSRSRLNQQQFTHDMFTVSTHSQGRISKTRTYRLLGTNLCRSAFTNVLGISEKRLRNVCRLHSAGITSAIRAPRSYTKSEQHEEAKT